MGNLGVCWRHGDRDIFLSLWDVSGCFDWCFRCGVVVSQRERASFKSSLGSICWDSVRIGIEVGYLSRNGLLFYTGVVLEISLVKKRTKHRETSTILLLSHRAIKEIE